MSAKLTDDRAKLDAFKAKMEAASARAMQGGDYMAAALCAVPWLVELAEEALQRRATAEPEAPDSTTVAYRHALERIADGDCWSPREMAQVALGRSAR